MQFADFDVDLFLRDYWQKRPLLIRNPWQDWRNPLEPDELAGLACEERVESRLITGLADRLALENGPFAESRFAELGDGPWTLLVQAVDHYVPEVAALIEPFRFVPDWRIDDVMVSYATDRGGVGPHFDQYDVFLVQGLGKRRWRIGAPCSSETPLLPHGDLRLLADFEASDEWVLEPGDILYVPPCVPHDGVAVGDDCMTYSVGFRAPALAELVEGWAAHQADCMSDDDRYADPELVRQTNPGEISASALDRLYGMALAALADRQSFARWFGIHTSTPKYAEADWRPEEPINERAVRQGLVNRALLRRNPASRFAFVRESGQAVQLFVDGLCFDCDGEMAVLAEALCAHTALVADPELARSQRAIALISALIDQGSLTFGQD